MMLSIFSIFDQRLPGKTAPKEDQISPHSRDDHGNTPLHLMAMKGLRAAAALQIENGADVDATNNDGDTPLHLAARARRRKVASLLVRTGGARTDISNSDGDTPLHLVAATGQVGIAALLLAAEDRDSGGVGRKNNRGNTPLHVAARAVQDHMYTFLLSRGGRWDVRNGDGETPRRLYGF
ncbi:unnamed protein product [Clonostachys rhizophaga]|uniref:Uncharacterized protein n=1 Tax=Clonostachys rhizophaga TaxID=160324 RepID=A0A9N9VAV7_9HYPO|nr:unnamed protein product [Clonostachys rhizophaga]